MVLAPPEGEVIMRIVPSPRDTALCEARRRGKIGPRVKPEGDSRSGRLSRCDGCKRCVNAVVGEGRGRFEDRSLVRADRLGRRLISAGRLRDHQLPSSLRSRAAQAPTACSVPSAIATVRGGRPQLVQATVRSGSASQVGFRQAARFRYRNHGTFRTRCSRLPRGEGLCSLSERS